VTLAIFDLDNTLIGGDSDHRWGEFLCSTGRVDPVEFAAQNDRFYQDYQEGCLDIHDYLAFALGPIRGCSEAEVTELQQRFMADWIEPILLPAAFALIDEHRQAGHELLIITATNSAVTRPIATRLGIDQLLACEAEIIDGVYTGSTVGIPSFREGKVARLEAWVTERGLSTAGAWFYSDSHNDLPLLEQVDNPVAVDPDPSLLATARERSWQVMSLR